MNYFFLLAFFFGQFFGNSGNQKIFTPTVVVTGISFVPGQVCNASPSSSVTTCTLTGVAAGDLLLIRLSTPIDCIVSVADSTGQTVETITTVPFRADTITEGAFYIADTNAGTHTFTITMCSATPYSLDMHEWTGASTTAPIDPLSSTMGFAQQIGSGTALSSGAMTTTGANRVIVGMCDIADGSSVLTPGTGFTLLPQNSGDTNNGTEYMNAPTAGSYTVTCTETSSTDWVAIGFALK